MRPELNAQIVRNDLHDEVLESRGGNGAFVRWLLVVVVGAGAFFAVKHFMGPKSAHAGWGHDWDSALDHAASSGKPLLVLFTADWCPPCRYLKSEVLPDPEVSRYLSEEFVLLKVDLTDRDGPNNRIADEYGVRGVPTFVVFNSRGEQVLRQSGAGPADVMLPWFKMARQRAR